MSTQTPEPHALNPGQETPRARRTHEDYEVHYSHEMTQETSAACGRLLLRTVPLLYGVLVGGLFDQLLVGVLLGLGAAALLDVMACDKSVLRPLLMPSRD